MLWYFYLTCFLAGATLMVCQFVMSLVGFGDHHDASGGHDVGADHDAGGHDAHAHDHAADHDAHNSWFVGVLTFRTLVAALAFFGLGGMAAAERLGTFGYAPEFSVLVAAAVGAVALFGVAFVMKSLHRLKSDGTVRIERAVGQSGTVYLTVPGQRGGVGKVMLNVQNRTVEYQAVTAHQPLPTGAKIVVVNVIGPDTVEVAPATESAGA